MATAQLFTPALASLGDLVPHEGMLTPEELERLATDVYDRRELWEPLVHVDPDQRRYELLYEDEHVDAWVLSWMPGQGTGFHDHYISGVGICVAAGGVREDLLVYGQTTWSCTSAPATHARAARGTSTACATRPVSLPSRSTSTRRGSTGWASTASTRTTGIVRREVRPGRNELTDQLIEQGALEHVLERF